MADNTQNPQILDEYALRAEIAGMVDRHQISPGIAQKLHDKIKERHLSLTRDQLYRLVDRLQGLLNAFPQQSNGTTTKPTTMPTNQDMKRLYDEVANLKDRLQAIELTTHDTQTSRYSTQPLTTSHHYQEKESLQPLQTIPSDPESIIIVMKWLSFMVDRIGKRSLPDVLGYYVDIGWISDDVRLDLINYSKGIIEDPNAPFTQNDTNHLPTKDHLQSLLFIQKLKGIHLDDRFLNRIDRDMEKMTKSLEAHTQDTQA